MITHYIGDAEVDGYLTDFAHRLTALGARRPEVWLPIGPSGAVLAERILLANPNLVTGTSVFPVHFNRGSKEVSIQTGDEVLAGRNALVLDSSVHSGDTMLEVVTAACSSGAATVTSYSLVLKRSSAFVPTFWGLTIDDHDRAYFLLEKIPNNRLKDNMVGTFLRRLTERDADSLEKLPCGVEAMDRIAWADRWFDIRSSERERATYLLYRGAEHVGYLTFARNSDAVTIDEVAVRHGLDGQGLGGILLRFAETIARQVGASEINMWAIEKQVPKYEHFEYKKAEGVKPMTLEGHRFHFMRKPILHHLSPMRLAKL